MCSKRAFSLLEGLLVLALVGLLSAMIAHLAAVAYPVQARQRAQLERTRAADTLLDELAKQSQVARAVMRLDTAEEPDTTECSLADSSLVIAWNGRSTTLFDVYSFDAVRHEVKRVRYKDNFDCAHPGSSALDDGWTPEGRVIARDVAGCSMQGRQEAGLHLLDLRVQLLDRQTVLHTSVVIP